MINDSSRVTPDSLVVTLGEIDDSGPQQLVASATGLAGQQIGDLVRHQSFGLSSNPPAGAEGLAYAPGGAGDRWRVGDLEHPKYRPANTPIGGTILYDAYGDVVSIVQQNMRIVHAAKITIQAPTIELIGNVTLGGADGSGVPAAKQGTIDTGGNADISNLATKVHVV